MPEARGVALPDGACCVFFTSGSTSVPKCVLSPHGGVARVTFDPRLGFGADTVLMQSASPAWDGFSFEVWCTPVNGGTVVPRDSEFFSFDDVRAAVAQGVNTVFLTPTLFNAAVTDDIEALDGIRAVMLGGEAVSVKAHRARPAPVPGADRVQPLRSGRGDHVPDRLPGERRGNRGDPDRFPARRNRRVAAGRQPASGAGGRSRRDRAYRRACRGATRIRFRSVLSV